MRRAMLFAALLLVGIVAVSVFHQLRREPTMGVRLAAALGKAGLADRLTHAPAFGEYAPGSREGFFEVDFPGGSIWLERTTRRVELRGRIAEAFIADPGRPREGAPSPLLVMPRDTRRVSPEVERVTLTGSLTGGDVEAEVYRLSFSRSEGGVRKLLEEDATVHAVLAQVVGETWGDLPRARRMVAEQQKALLAMPERALFDAILAADLTVLERDDEPASAVRRALLLAARTPTDIAVTWQGGRAYALADRMRAPSGEAVVRGMGFSPDGRLAWSAILYVREGVDPERTRRVMEGAGGTLK